MQQLEFSGAVIAQCLGISRRQHSNLVRDRILPSPVSSKLYPLAASVRAYLDYKLGSHGNLAEEKVRLVAEQRRKLEIANSERVKELIQAEHVAWALQQFSSLTVQRISELPGRIAAGAAQLGVDAAELRALCVEEVNAARTAIAADIEAAADELELAVTEDDTQ